MSNAQYVKEFHKAFSIEKRPFHEDIRFKLLMEEWNEYCEAAHALREDPTNVTAKVELLDAMADMVYVIYGTADVLGWDLDEAMRIVQESNMSKLDDEGKPLLNGINCPLDESRPKGKVLKSNNFFEPDLKDLVTTQYIVPDRTLILREDLENLEDTETMWLAHENAGVDNWTGQGEAMDLYREYKGEQE